MFKIMYVALNGRYAIHVDNIHQLVRQIKTLFNNVENIKLFNIEFNIAVNINYEDAKRCLSTFKELLSDTILLYEDISAHVRTYVIFVYNEQNADLVEKFTITLEKEEQRYRVFGLILLSLLGRYASFLGHVTLSFKSPRKINVGKLTFNVFFAIYNMFRKIEKMLEQENQRSPTISYFREFMKNLVQMLDSEISLDPSVLEYITQKFF